MTPQWHKLGKFMDFPRLKLELLTRLAKNLPAWSLIHRWSQVLGLDLSVYRKLVKNRDSHIKSVASPSRLIARTCYWNKASTRRARLARFVACWSTSWHCLRPSCCRRERLYLTLTVSSCALMVRLKFNWTALAKVNGVQSCLMGSARCNVLVDI